MDNINFVKGLMYLSMDIVGNTHPTTVKLSQILDILILEKQKELLQQLNSK